MKRPDPPFLEFGYFFRQRAEADSMCLLIDRLLRGGAEFAGEIEIRRGIGIRHAAFASTNEQPGQHLVQIDVTMLRSLLLDNDVRVEEVSMINAIGIVPNGLETLTYYRISDRAVGSDRHPLAILAYGGVFSNAVHGAEVAEVAGQRAYNRFISLVTALQPGYAAITFEWSLECPSDLRDDPRSLAFRDFYVSDAFIGTQRLERVRQLFSGAYVESLESGLYISSRALFNPARVELESEQSQWLSCEVGKLIGSLAPRKG